MSESYSAESVVELTGLAASSPIAFMAALGLLRVCSQDHGLPVRLSWNPSHARLHGIDREALLETLIDHMKGRAAAPEFNFEVVSEKGNRSPVMHLRELSPGDFRAAAAAMNGDRRALGFLAGFGTDAVITDKGFVARTKFDFSSGQQRLAEQFRDLAKLLDPLAKRPRLSLAERIARSLFGGPYEEQHTFGWDPASLMSHAHQRAAPTDSATPGQPMTVWLAVESLPLHPVISVDARRARTTGFSASNAYVWPQWSAPLCLAEAAVLRQRPVQSLNVLAGVTAVWTAGVTSVGKYGFLLPGARTLSVGATPGRFAQAGSEYESTG